MSLDIHDTKNRYVTNKILTFIFDMWQIKFNHYAVRYEGRQYTFCSSDSSREMVLLSHASLFNVVGTLFFICQSVNQFMCVHQHTFTATFLVPQ